MLNGDLTTCIPDTSVCDGLMDCLDGSDEAETLCQSKKTCDKVSVF